MSDRQFVVADLLAATEFAAGKHSTQRRKNVEASPYINHPIRVAHLLAAVGGITDLATLIAAVLHDTLEDTNTTSAELDALFGPLVRSIVEEVTDDKSLVKAERKRLQVEHAPHLSPEARAIKLGDKIANVLDVTDSPPSRWDQARRLEYLDWTEAVVAGCRGTNVALEQYYDDVLAKGRTMLAGRA